MATILFGCAPKLEKLTIKRISNLNNTNSLKLEGFYYEKNKVNRNIIYPYFFYTNGVLFSYPIIMDSLDYSLKEIKNNKVILNTGIAASAFWGVFNIREDAIEFEKWASASCCGGKQKTIIRKGKIINDSTFVMNILIDNYENGKIYKSKDTFYFKECHNKPDSINIFTN